MRSSFPGTPARPAACFTVGELDTVRTTTLPFTLLRGYELRGRYLQFAKESATNARITAPSVNRLENLMKVRRRQLDALLEGPLMAEKRRREAELRSRVKADKALHARTGDPWREIDAAEARMRQMFYPYTFIEEGSGFDSQLYRWAKTLVRGTDERDKPNNERLREFTDTRLARVEQLLLTPAPVYPEVERLTMTFGLERMREWLGPDAPIVRQLLVKESPDALAARLVEKSSLADVEVRRTLWKEGRAAVQASQDPLIQLVRDLESQARPLRTAFDDEVEAPLRKASERLARARFAVYGTRVYPDATYTLRLNYGSVRGWNESAATRRAVHAPGADVRARHRLRPIRAAEALARGERPARHGDARQLRLGQRHHRRQLRQPGGERQRRSGGHRVRRQHPHQLRHLLVRRRAQPDDLGAPRLPQGGPDQDLRRDGGLRRTVGALDPRTATDTACFGKRGCP